jgi:hypothetical protein
VKFWWRTPSIKAQQPEVHEHLGDLKIPPDEEEPERTIRLDPTGEGHEIGPRSVSFDAASSVCHTGVGSVSAVPKQSCLARMNANSSFIAIQFLRWRSLGIFLIDASRRTADSWRPAYALTARITPSCIHLQLDTRRIRPIDLLVRWIHPRIGAL